MKTTPLILGLAVALIGTSAASAASARIWTNTKGAKVEATFIRLDGDKIVIQTLDGTLHTLPLSVLVPEDQEVAKTMKPAENAGNLLSVSANATPAQAAAKIDELVLNGIARANPRLQEAAKKSAEDMVKAGKKPEPFVPLKPNPAASDEQFVRRIYLDIVGRIPTHTESTDFLKNASRDKDARAKLIDKLLLSDGYSSHMYNYMAEMLRIIDDFDVDFVRGLPYIEWMKAQIKENRPWDKVVYDMLTAKGKMWHNGATGYLLRDSGMPLDNLANTLTIFLGTDVSCAQCHDHPFADWTQKQFYEMAAYFGATSTQMGRNDFKNGSNPAPQLTEQALYIMEKNGADPRRYRNAIQNLLSANRYTVNDLPENRLKLPHDYQYKDGNPGEKVAPKLIMWSEADKDNPAFAAINQAGDISAENLRDSFAKWLTHPSNPRFAMTIANRLWSRAFGLALTPTPRNIDNPDEAYNPELLKHLANEMVRVKFDLREFMRIIYNTKSYQREATTADLAMGAPYYFQGPVLRRMTAEQAWDSYMTLVLGDGLDKVKSHEADLYGKAIDMNLNTVDPTTVLLKLNAIQTLQKKQEATMMGGGLDMAGGNKKNADSEAEAKVLSYGDMKLMRASELPQPAPGGHFLTEFGQSSRILIDGGSTEGSVPQVLMMMNGKAQEMLTNKDSLIFRTMSRVNSPSDKVEAMFVSILNRRPTLHEKDIAKRVLNANGDNGYANMIWALINTREFSFIQ